MTKPSKGVSIEALALLNAAHRSTVPDMGDDDIGILRLFTEDDGSALCRVEKAGAVEAVTTGGIFFVPFVGDGVHKACFGHSLMPRRVDNRTVRNIRQDFLSSFDTHNIGGIVQRP